MNTKIGREKALNVRILRHHVDSLKKVETRIIFAPETEMGFLIKSRQYHISRINSRNLN